MCLGWWFVFFCFVTFIMKRLSPVGSGPESGSHPTPSPSLFFSLFYDIRYFFYELVNYLDPVVLSLLCYGP